MVANQVAGLVLAGGMGKRLGGRDKAFVTLQGRPLIAHVLDRLGQWPGPLAISANGDPARFLVFDLPVLADHFADQGPLSGIHSGLLWAESRGARAVITVSVDCPFLPFGFAAALINAGGPGLATPAFARAGGRDHPTIALWPVHLLPALTAHLASPSPPRLGHFLIAQGAAIADFGDHPGFANINTADDLARAEATRAKAWPQ